MIDTLKLRLTDYKIDGFNQQLQIQPGLMNLNGEIERETCLFRANGKEFFGSKAFLNDPDKRFRFDVTPKGTFFTTEVPKWLGNSNYHTVSKEQFKEFAGHVERTLNNNCIKTNINNSAISRIDIFKNGIMQNNPEAYFSVFRMCEGKRTHKRDYGSTVLWHNTQREITFYDKYQQMKSKGFPLDGIPRNVLRGEMRLIKSSSVKRFAKGILSFADLKHNYGELGNIYNHQLSSMIFKYGSGQEQQLDFWGDDVEKLKVLKARSGRTAVKDWIAAEGINQIMQRYSGDIGSIRKVLSEVYTKGAVSKQMKKIEDLIKMSRSLGKENKEFFTLYDELVNVFLKAA